MEEEQKDQQKQKVIIVDKYGTEVEFKEKPKPHRFGDFKIPDDAVLSGTVRTW